VGGSRRIASARSGAEQAQVGWLLFAVAAVISVVLIGFAGSGQTLKGDEWGFADRLATEPLFHAILHPPPGKYLIVLPMLFYKVAFSAIGIGSYLPYRLVGMALTTATAALFLLLAARRVGPLVALPGAVLILFLGSSSEVTATALRIPTQIALVAGLGMLLCLEHRDLRADLAACGLLLISITSHPLGTAFAASAAVLVLSRPAPERWRRVWVFGVPLLVFAAWYVTLREPPPVGPSFGDQLRDLPRFEAQSLAVMAAAATGVFHWPTTHFLTPLSGVLAGAIVLLTAARVLTRRMPPEFWAILAAMIVLFGAPAFAAGGVRSPAATRYILPGVVMLLLLLSEQAGDIRFASPRGRVLAGAGAAVFLFAIVCNAIVLEQNARMWAAAGSRVRAELAAVDLARGHVEPAFRAEDPTSAAAGQPGSFGLAATTYFAIEREYGSPAFTPAQLRVQSAPVRSVADAVLARALALHLAPVATMPPTRNPPPHVLATTGEVRASMPGCVRLTPGGASSSSQIELPPKGVALADARRTNELALERFGAVYGYRLEPTQSTRVAVLRIPPDDVGIPWKLLIVGGQRPVDVCAFLRGAPVRPERDAASTARSRR
jgi:hypothetical protein